MAPSRIPYPDHGQGISFFSACCPSHLLDPQTAAVVLVSDSAWRETLSARQASVTADVYACVVCGALR
jgi:hypothetical protein